MSNYTSVFKKKDQSSCESSNPTGSAMDQESLSFIPGMKKEMKLMRIRFFILLIISNIAVAFIVAPADQEVTESTVVELIEHPGHTKLKLSLKLALTIPQNVSEIPVSLYDQQKRQVIALAYLHPIESPSEEADFMQDEKALEYEVEIKESEIKKVIHLQSTILSAYPYSPVLEASNHTTKRSLPYEIQF